MEQKTKRNGFSQTQIQVPADQNLTPTLPSCDRSVAAAARDLTTIMAFALATGALTAGLTARVGSPKARRSFRVSAAQQSGEALWLPGVERPNHLEGVDLPGNRGFDPLNLGIDSARLKWSESIPAELNVVGTRLPTMGCFRANFHSSVPLQARRRREDQRTMGHGSCGRHLGPGLAWR